MLHYSRLTLIQITDKHLSEELKGAVCKALLLPTLRFAVEKFGPCVKIYSSVFGVSITSVLVVCAVWNTSMLSATMLFPRISFVVWAFLTSTATFLIGFFVGLATSHVCP